MNALLAAHEDDFLHGLAPSIHKRGRVFERGFLVQASADEVSTHPAFGTVRTLIRATPSHDDHALASLEELRAIPQAGLIDNLRQLTRPLSRVHTLTLHGPHWDRSAARPQSDWWSGQEELATRFRQITAFPHLRHVGLLGTRAWSRASGPGPKNFGWLFGFCELNTLMVTGHPSHLPAWLDVQAKRGIRKFVLSTRGTNEDERACEVQVTWDGALDITIATGAIREDMLNPLLDTSRALDVIERSVDAIHSITIDERIQEAIMKTHAGMLEKKRFGRVSFGQTPFMLGR